jgi:hypothetical protein
MVEVFKTSVQLPEQATLLVKELLSQFPQIKINFDLDDCDKVLRVEGETIVPNKIIELLTTNGHHCQVLEE